MNRAIRSSHRGFSLIELMIALTIGLLLLSGLTAIFVSSSDVNREMRLTSQQIENGRYAIETLAQDLRMAGFYGHLHDTSAIPAPATIPPDPCESAVVEIRKNLRYAIQGYRGTIHATTRASDTAPDFSATACSALLTAANLSPGSDVVVIRRADTNALLPADTPELNVLYIQASAIDAEIQLGRSVATVAIGTDKNAKGSASVLSLTNNTATPAASPIRKFHTRVYFVAPCSVGSATSGACTGAASEDTIPTLKRLDFTGPGAMTIVPLVEGIEYLKIEYGVDNLPNVVNVATQLIGDGTVDSYKEVPADWTTVVAAKVFLLARNTELTTGFTDDKTYALGVDATDNFTTPLQAGTNARFKRHVYTAAVQLINVAGRREIP